MDRPTCKTCPFFTSVGFDEGESGQCRRHAPRPIMATYEDSENCAMPTLAIWPQIFFQPHLGPEGVDFCGEHPDFPDYIANLKALTPDDLTVRSLARVARGLGGRLVVLNGKGIVVHEFKGVE